MQTRDQKYAAIVYDQVSRIENQEEYKQYGAMAHKLPILIRTAGLTQALEFVNARGKGLQKQLLEDLAVTVEQNDTANLLSSVRSANLSEYMRLTQHIMAALLWYKRFAQSILKVDVSEAALLPEEEKK
jgi:CRISPR-associated protein Cmr5